MKPHDRIQRAFERLKKMGIRAENEKHISNYVFHLKAKDMSIRRILKYIHYLGLMASWTKKNFLETERVDIEAVGGRINAQPFAAWTKSDMKVMLKAFFKWLEGDSEEFPKKVRWIKSGVIKNKLLPEDLLSPEEIKALLEACTGMKEKAFISVLYEGALRIGELRSMKIKHVDPNGYGIRITVPCVGKTGLRKILLINSVPYLSNWLAHHPAGDNPEAPLWICESNWGKRGRNLSYNSLCKIIKAAARKTGTVKPVNFHAFRHARLTYLAKHLKESELKEYAGWTAGSKMAGVYVHLSARDMDEAVLRMHGKSTSERESSDRTLRPRDCPRCEKVNEADARICCRCGLPLDVRTAMDLKQKSDMVASVMPQEVIEQLVELVAERLANRTPPAPLTPCGKSDDPRISA